MGLGKLELVIQNGLTTAVNGILLTKDESILILYSADNTIKIWEKNARNKNELHITGNIMEVGLLFRGVA